MPTNSLSEASRRNSLARLHHLEEWLRSRRYVSRMCLDGYRDDISAYARDILNVRLTPDQTAACDALPIHKRVLLPSGNETGKSFVEAVIAMHHYDCFNPGVTIITAPAERQLTDIVFKELRTLSPDKPGWRPRANYLSDAANHFLTGYTARNETAFHGRHEAHVLVLFDEAEEIPRDFWDAAESMADWMLAAYNPILTSSPAAIAERNSRWAVRRMSALNHPNVIADLAGQPRFLAGNAAVNAEKVLSRLQAWATPVKAGDPEHPDDLVFGTTRWRLGPVAQARLLGVRPTGATNSVFSESLWTRMIDMRCDLKPHWPLQVGVDMARFGDDFTCIVVRRGKCVLHAEKRNGWVGPQVIERLKALLEQFCNERENVKDIPVLIDDTGGYGNSVVDYADGYRIIPVNVGWKASKDAGAESYVDVRTELWFQFVDLVDNDLVDTSRLSMEMLTELHDELITPQYDYDRRLRRIMSPKTATKDALGRSPDLADALMLAFAVNPPYYEAYSLLR